MDIKPTSNNQFSELNPILSSLQNEAHILFEKLAKVKGETVEETIENTETASRNYLQALEIEITFKNDLPTDINKYEEKLIKVASAIEYCWHLLSPESRDFFINLAYGFTKVTISISTGITGLTTWMKLFLPSIKQGENLFKKYKNAMLLIPKAVDKAINSTDPETSAERPKQTALLLEKVDKGGN